MTDQQKSKIYEQLMYENDRLTNQISLLKNESIDLSKQQLEKIAELQKKHRFIMTQLQSLMR